MIPVPGVYSINTLALAWTRARTNGYGVTVVVFQYYTEGDAPPPDPEVVLVTLIPLVLEQCPVILLI